MPDATWPFAFNEDSAWGRCFHAFLRSALERSGSTSTYKRYKHVLSRFLTDPVAKLPDRYTREDVEMFLHQGSKRLGQIGNPIGPGTHNSRLGALNSFYAYAAKYTITGNDGTIHPLLQTTPPTLGMRQLQRVQNPRSITYADFEKLISVIPKHTERGLRDYTLIIMYFWTARRESEILNLRLKDIEETTLINEDGTRRQGWIYHWKGKGRGRIDDISELPQPAKDAIDAYLIGSGRMDTIKPEDALFVASKSYRSGSPDRPIRPQTMWKNMKLYVKAAGLDPTTTVHSLRHFAVQQRAMSGAGIREIQKLLRHKSLQTTDTYLSVLMSTTDPGITRLMDKFGKF